MLKWLYYKFFIGRKRLKILEHHGWYKSMTGGYVNPHCLDFMSRHEILKCTPDEL